MTLLAGQTQDFLDEQSKRSAEAAGDHKDLRRLLGDFESERKTIGELVESVADQGDSTRRYSVQIQLLENGLKELQGALKSLQDRVEKLSLDTERTAKVLKSSLRGDANSEQNSSRAGGGVPLGIVVFGMGAVATIVWFLAKNMG